MENERIKVYKIDLDGNDFQSLEPVDISKKSLLMQKFDGSAKKEIWTPQKVEIMDPKRRQPDIFFQGDFIMVGEEVYKKVAEPFFRMAGEVLPLIGEEGQPYYLLNVTECYKCLDREKTKFRFWFNGRGIDPEIYAFRNRFPESSIFKIPETATSEILVWERYGDPDSEFKAAVEEHKLTGIRFELLWEGEDKDD